MSRNLTTNAEAKAKTALGTEPIFILKIEWPSGTKYYADKAYTFGAFTCETSLLEHGEIQSQGKQGSIGEISAIDFVLDDTDGDLKNRVNTDIIEGTKAVAYHHYVDLGSSDATVLLSGRLSGPIEWSEGERTLGASLESVSATGAGEVGFAPAEDSIENLLDSAAGIPWPICFGSPRMVKAVKTQQIEPTQEELDDDPEALAHDLIYVVNLYPSSNVTTVYAKRNCYGDPGFFVVPSSYYTIDTSYSYGGKTVTAILMSQPLSSRDDSGWSDQIYVDLVSTLSQNTATQIKWILDTFSSLNTDAASFAAVATKIGILPSHWTLFDQQDALKLAEEMAWQARCALFVKDDTVYIKYLAETPVTDNIISRNEQKLKSLNLGFTPTEDIITKFKAHYVSDYSGDPASEKEYIYTNNTAQFGVVDEDYDFFIYTNEVCAKVAATFWGYRYSNSWRQVNLTTFLPTLAIEAYDWINIDIPAFSINQLPGLATLADHDFGNHEINFEIEMASSAGTAIDGQPSLDSNYYSAGNSLITSVGLPVASPSLKTVCEPLVDQETINTIIDNGDTECIKCRVINGSSSGWLAHEIIGLERLFLGYVEGERAYENILLLGTPTKNNQIPSKVMFTRPGSVTGSQIGCCYSASNEPQWTDYDLNPGIHPGYSEDNHTIVGDTVGTVKGSKALSKKSFGFNVVGVESQIAVTNGSLDPKLEKVYADEPIEAYSPSSLTGVFTNDAKHIQKPVENSEPAGKIMFPIEDIAAGDTGLAYNAFDATGWPDGDEPSNLGVEVGTKGGTFEIAESDNEGNPLTGFIVTGRKGGKNQVRPF